MDTVKKIVLKLYCTSSLNKHEFYDKSATRQNTLVKSSYPDGIVISTGIQKHVNEGTNTSL